MVVISCCFDISVSIVDMDGCPQIQNGTSDIPSSALDQLECTFMNFERHTHFREFFRQDVDGVVRLVSGLRSLDDVIELCLRLSLPFSGCFTSAQVHRQSHPTENKSTEAHLFR